MQCPVCYLKCDSAPWKAYTIDEAASHFCPPTRNHDRFCRLRACISRLWGEAECRVYFCENCGFGFSDPYTGGDEEFYSILHEQSGYPSWRWDYDLALKLIGTDRVNGKILDVGAGTGAFLSKLAPSWNKFAVEGSETTRAVLRKQGFYVFNDLSDAIAQKIRFDVITLFQVLEHLANFREILKQCANLLRPGGKIVITVPDAAAMRRQEVYIGCADMPPNHVNKWTPVSLKLALSEVDLEVGTPVYQPASLATLRGILHLRILAQRKSRYSLSSAAYRISSKKLRRPLVGLLALPAFVQIAPNIPKLWKDGAFGIVAHSKKRTA